jgi:hypothetical protein
MTSFSDILNTPSADVKPPKPLPIGTYLCLIDGTAEIKQMGKEQNYGAIIKLKPVQAGPDVDQAALIESLDGKSLSEVGLQTTFWLTDKAKYRLNDFLVGALGMEQGTKTMGELLNDIPGKQVNASITHTPSKDNTVMYTEVKSFARV